MSPVTARSGRPALALSGLAAFLVIAGCTGTPAEPPVPSAPAPTTAASVPSSSSPSGGPTSASAPQSSESVREAPPAATAPAPSTAGPLTASDLPTEVLGFVAQEREPTEGEYVPNGSWVRSVDGEQAAWEAMPQCDANRSSGWPVPTYALAGTYSDSGGRPGNALALQFDTSGDAQGYATVYRQVLASCPRADSMSAVTEVASTGAWYVGRRDYSGSWWSEVVFQRDDRVVLLIINDGRVVTDDQLRGFAARLAEG